MISARHRHILLFALVLLGVGAPGARADVYCVDVADASCTSQISGATPGQRLAAAVSTAVSHAGADTVRFGPGTYDTTNLALDGSGGLTVVGPGPDKATVRSTVASGAANTLTLGAGTVSVSGFTVEVPPTPAQAYGIRASGVAPSLFNLTVRNAAPSTATSLDSGIRLDVGGTVGNGITIRNVNEGIEVTGTGPVQIANADIVAYNYGVWVNSRANQDPVTVRASKLESTATESTEPSAGMTVWAGTAIVRNVVSTSTGNAFVQLCDTNTTVTFDRVTAVGGSGKPAINTYCDSAHTLTTSITRSLLPPPAKISVSRNSAVPASANTATIATTRWDGAANVSATDGAVLTPGAGMVTTVPAFVSGTDLHLAAGSPLIDGLPAATAADTGSSYDPDFGVVSRDGDGDGVARADFGAYEVQPPAVPLPAGNLLQTPGAEAPGAGSGGVSAPLPPAPWTRTAGNFTFVRTGVLQPFVLDRLGAGENVFVGGPDSPSSSAEQVVDLSASAGGIDTGNATATLAALIGGAGDEGDNGTVTATFRGADKAPLAKLVLGPVTPDQRDLTSILMPRSGTAPIPVGTRSVAVEMTATLVPPGTYNAGLFDNLALTAEIPAAPTSTPPAGTATPSPTPAVPAPVFRGVVLPKGRLRLDRKGRIALKLTCPKTAKGRCTGTVRARAELGRRKKTQVGRVSLSAAAGKRVTLRLRLSRKARRAVKRKGRLTLSLSATVSDATKRPATTTSSVRALKARRRGAS